MTWKRSSIIQLFISLAVVVVGCFDTQMAPAPEGVEVVEEYDISSLGEPLNENMHNVDIVTFHSDNTEVTWDELQEEFQTADRIFCSYGVQLNLEKALDVTHPSSWKGMIAGKATHKPQDGHEKKYRVVACR